MDRSGPPAAAAAAAAAVAAVAPAATATTTTTTCHSLSAAAAAAARAASSFRSTSAAAAQHTYQPQQEQQPEGDVCAHLPDVIRSHVHHVICTSLPWAETQAYRQAWHHDAELVHRESDPVDFVRYGHYDLWAGAKRLCRYWTERLLLFGLDRAFLPLSLTGTGALTPQDVVTVLSGAASLLPSTKHGQQCILVDRRKLLPEPVMTTESRLRSVFYLFHCLAQRNHQASANEQAMMQQHGVLAFIVMATPRNHEVHWNFAHRCSFLAYHVFPLRLQFRFLAIPHKNKISLASYCMSCAIHVLRQFYGNDRIDVQVYMQTEPDRILKEMCALGMSRKAVPSFLGGEWEYQEFYASCQEQKTRDEERFKDKLLPAATAAAAMPSPATLLEQSILNQEQSHQGGTNMLGLELYGTDSERATHTTRTLGRDLRTKAKVPPSRQQQHATATVNAAAFTTASMTHSDYQDAVVSMVGTTAFTDNELRNRGRKRPPPPPPQVQAAAAGPEEEGLSNNNNNYTSATTTTTTAVAAWIQSSLRQEDRLARRRLADLFHSRRKRERKRQFVSMLQTECNTLWAERQALQSEHERLQQLLTKAHEKVVVIHEDYHQAAAAARMIWTPSSSSVKEESFWCAASTSVPTTSKRRTK